MPHNKLVHQLQSQLVHSNVLTEDDVQHFTLDEPIPDRLVKAISDVGSLFGEKESEKYSGHLLKEVDLGSIAGLIELLGKPRCGVPASPEGDIQIQTFGAPGGRWSHGLLTYSVDPTGCNLDPITVNNTINGAFAQWGAVYPSFFSFTRVPSGGDIRVRFGGSELDPKFGNLGGVVGSGAYPEVGSLNFDSTETWSAAFLLSVALHEIGHVLGLSHSNDPASLMYPFDMNNSVIDAESADALRSLYGWSPQIQLGDRGTSDRPALAYTSFADFTTSTTTLHMVWKGVGGDQGIYESEFAGGGWTAQRKIHGIGSTQSPALAAIPRPGPIPATDLAMAWRGVEGDQGLYWSTNDGSGWQPQQNVSGVGSSHRPALAAFDGLFMVWKGIEDDQGIYFSTMSGGNWEPQQNVTGVGTSAAPALVVFQGRLYVFWKGIEGDSTIYYSSRAPGYGGIWTPQRQVAYAVYQTGGGVWGYPGTANGPSATVRGNRVLLSWRGVEGDQGIWYSLFDGNEFTGQINIADVGTSQGPSVCTVAARTYMAWKGIEDDSCIYWSYL